MKKRKKGKRKRGKRKKGKRGWGKEGKWKGVWREKGEGITQFGRRKTKQSTIK